MFSNPLQNLNRLYHRGIDFCVCLWYNNGVILIWKRGICVLNGIFCGLAMLATLAFYFLFPTTTLWCILPITLGFYVAAVLLYFVFIIISSLFMLSKKPIDRPNPMGRFLITVTMEWLMQLFRINVTVKGLEKLPNEPCVIISNHRSALDPMTLLAVMKKRHLVYMCKAEIMRIPIVGWYLYHAGFIGVDRKNAMRASRSLVTAAEEMKRTGVDVGIYPEGTRSKTGKLLRFKPGAFVLAEKASAPIVVMTTKGTERVTKELFWKKTEIEMEVLEVWSSADMAGFSHNELAERAHSLIDANLSE
jgi:1-acyl-sn-glycerol-3-phosphate acyltransferase